MTGSSPQLEQGDAAGADHLTDQPQRVLVSETIREKLLHHTRDELPFSIAVVVDQYDEPDRPGGLVKVYCHFHSHMSAVARVFNHPWFTIPEGDGTFTIDGVPAGEHTVVAWHERIGERRDVVRIRPGAATTITFTLPVLEPTK